MISARCALQDVRHGNCIRRPIESCDRDVDPECQSYRNRSVIAGVEPSQYRNASDMLSTERRALESQKAAGWRARWKATRLRSRAGRAEAQAAARLYDASVSFGKALEAVLHAAVAREKADEAGFQSVPHSFSPTLRSGR